MFRVKICGITTASDAAHAIRAGADAIGLNFYAPSPRYIKAGSDLQIRDAIGTAALAVGVFVDATVPEILATQRRLSLDVIQLSGNEGAEVLQRLASECETPVIRAVRAKDGDLTWVNALLESCEQLACRPAGLLWDAHDSRQFGGTGRVADWTSAAAYVASGRHPPLLLAGGLKPANVAEAIKIVHPIGVDTASGVESAPGVKDPRLVAEFVALCHMAFDNVAAGG